MNFIFEWSTRYLTSERSSLVRYGVENEKIKFISISEYVIFCLLYKHQWNTNRLAFKGAIYYVTITTVISSHVKITCYIHMWRYEVFPGKLTWYFTGVYIINWSYRRHCVTRAELHFFHKNKSILWIYYVTITTVISSHVRITCYLHMWRYEVFAGKLTWYFTGVYIINWSNRRHCVTRAGLPFFHKRKGILKIDQSVKMPWHRLSMGVASSY